MHEESQIVIERFSAPQPIPSRFAPVTFLLDFTKRKYLYVDESCFDLTGYTASYFLETGLEDYLKLWHPSDFGIMNKKVIPDNLEFLKTLPAEKYGSIVFSYNYRTRNSEGNFVSVLQRFSYIPSNIPGIPFGIIGVVFDITHFKNEQSIVHTIEETLRYNDGIVNKLIFKKTHPVYDIPICQLMSKRELEVLAFMAKGLSSKQIAYKLRLSANTINNHRKKMLKKVNCKTSSELINHAVKHGLL